MNESKFQNDVDGYHAGESKHQRGESDHHARENEYKRDGAYCKASESIKTRALFSECSSQIISYLYSYEYPWLILGVLEKIIIELGATLSESEFYSPREGVWISRSATVEPSAYVGAPSIVMDNAQVRHCAYIRGYAFIGAGAVVGNSTEVKSSILLDYAAAPHFNYVGDSILGYRAHLGAGAVCSNLRLDKETVKIRMQGGNIATGMRKLGAIVADRAQIGCGTVLNPGTVVLPDAHVKPLSSVLGVVR